MVHKEASLLKVVNVRLFALPEFSFTPVIFCFIIKRIGLYCWNTYYQYHILFIWLLLNFAVEATVCEKLNHLGSLDAISNSEDPQACTLYANNIYDTNRVIEVCVWIENFS